MTLASNFHALVLRRFHWPVYFKNGFGANVEYLLNSTNHAASNTYKPKNDIFFWLFNNF